jgi:Lamin Tail Domain
MVVAVGLVLLFGAACSDDASTTPDGGTSPGDGPGDGPGAKDQASDIKVAPPTDVLITEFLADPKGVTDAYGEWIELHNPTAVAVDLTGWTLKDDGYNKHVFGSLTIGPGEYKVLARSADPKLNGGVQNAYPYADFTLTNSGDQIVLLDKAGKEVDRVVYPGALVNPGYSAALRALNLDNANAGSWCPSLSSWAGGAGDFGSPGAANACGTVKPPLDAGVPADQGPPPDTGGLPYLKNSISFNGSLCPNIANGSKKITLRNKHYYGFLQVGEWVKLKCSTSPAQYFKGQLTAVRLTTWGGITATEYMADGFKDQSQMMSIMQTYYAGITLSDKATVIRWTKTAPLP